MVDAVGGGSGIGREDEDDGTGALDECLRVKLGLVNRANDVISLNLGLQFLRKFHV